VPRIQTAQVLKNVRTAPEAAGARLDRIAKATVHLTELHRDYDGFNRVYCKYFRELYPVHTTV
jgi:2-iminobutanoate/2-iminopropanoate deaminase